MQTQEEKKKTHALAACRFGDLSRRSPCVPACLACRTPAIRRTLRGLLAITVARSNGSGQECRRGRLQTARSCLTKTDWRITITCMEETEGSGQAGWASVCVVSGSGTMIGDCAWTYGCMIAGYCLGQSKCIVPCLTSILMLVTCTSSVSIYSSWF